jgi:hypothetical protein
MNTFFRFILFFGLLTVGFGLHAQGTQVEFGKNRVQYHKDFSEWSQYESPNFITYWYGKARLVGEAVVNIAEHNFKEVEALLDHRMNDKIEILVFVDLTDFKQSNIGAQEEFTNLGGQTKIVDNKMFVYFNGSHTDLRRQIREGIAAVYLNYILYGSNLQEIVQNSNTFILPPWYKEGLIAYAGEAWNTDLDNELRDVFLNDLHSDFNALAAANPRLAGHSLWYFLGQNYGRATVSNLLYLTRINRSVESGFLYVLGSSLNRTTRTWYNYFSERYKGEVRFMDTLQTGQEVPIRNRKKLTLTQVKLSSDSKKIAYVLNDMGLTKVYIHDLETNRRKRVQKMGFRNPFQPIDYNYPLLAWSPGSTELSVLYERRDVIKLLKYDVDAGKGEVTDMAPQFQRVYSIDYLTNTDYVLSASERGQSDLYTYFSRTRQPQRITNDFWDDLDARVVRLDGKPGIIFASNRPDTLLRDQRLDTILPIDTYDLFYLELGNPDRELVRLTHSGFGNERSPMGIDERFFSFLSDESGIYNRYYGYLETYVHHYNKVVRFQDGSDLIMHPDSSLSTQLDSLEMMQVDTVELVPVYKRRAVNQLSSNLRLGLLDQHAASRTGQMVEVVRLEGRNRVFLNQIDTTLSLRTDETLYRRKYIPPAMRAQQKPQPPVDRPLLPALPVPKAPVPAEEPPQIPEPPVSKPDTGKIDIDNYLFQSEFDDDEPPVVIQPEREEPNRMLERASAPAPVQLPAQKKIEPESFRFRSSKIIPARLKFRTDYLTSTLDNSMLFEGLNTFAGTPMDFGFPPPGILLKTNFKDVFEDHHIELGARIPTSFNGAEYFMVYDNLKNRLDKRFAAYYRTLRFQQPIGSTISPIVPRYKNKTFLMQYQVRYPLNIFSSFRAISTLRFDNTLDLSTDINSLVSPVLREQRAGLRGEYVFDNTIITGLNMMRGTRYKVYVEMVKRFQVDLGANPSFDFNEGFMTLAGFDFRHYIPVLKKSVLATRLAAATSFGSERILYYLGGVDFWLFPSFNQDIPAPTEGNFAYQTVATNMRGFQMNIRNGNSFAVSNTELRVPVFQYLSKNNLRRNFLRNFQLVGFFDVGTAWQGVNPFDDENPLNTKIIPDPPIPGNPVTIKVRYFRDPIVMGYGVGARMLLFGYFLRIDYGWGVETRVVQSPRILLSMGMDF